MHDEAPILSATKRDRTGSRYSKRLRDQGKLPAIVYGHKETPVPVALDAKETITHIMKGEKVYRIEIEGGGTETVLLRDLQYDYLGTNIVHCDLSRVDLNERVHTKVPIHLVGEAKGLKKAGAALMHPTSEIELECVVTNMPDFIEVDISDMDVGDTIHAGDIELPMDTMVLLTDPHAELAHIVFHHAVTEETDEAGEAEAQAAPERVGEKKDEDEGEDED